MNKINKFIAILLMWTMVLGSVVRVSADTSYDVTAPIIHSFIIENNESISAKGTMNILMDITEDGSGVKSVNISFLNAQTNQYVYIKYDAMENDGVLLFSGKNAITLNLEKQSSYFIEGEYQITNVIIEDLNANKNYYSIQKDEIEGATKLIKVLEADSMDINGPLLRKLIINNPEDVILGKDVTGTLDIEETSGLSSFTATYINAKNEELFIYGICDNKLITGNYEMDLYVDSTEITSIGDCRLVSIQAEDIYGNISVVETEEWDKELFTNKIEIIDLSQIISISSVEIVEEKITTPNVLTLNLGLNSNEVGIEEMSLTIANENGHKKVLHWNSITPIKGENAQVKVPVNTYIENGNYHIEQIVVYSELSKSRYSGEKLDNILSGRNSIEISSKYNIVYYGSTSNISGVTKALKAMSDGQVAIVEYSQNPIVHKEIFEAIVGRDITVVFENYDIQWVFNGKEIDFIKCKTIDLSVKLSIASGEPLGYIDDDKVLKLTFADNGELPGKVKIRLNNEYLQAKYRYQANMVLSYYDKTPEVIDEKVLCETDGYVEIEITHNSTYILSDNLPRLAAPGNFQIECNDTKKVTLKWNKVYGAIGYKIYRSSTKNGTMKQIMTIDSNDVKTIVFEDKTVSKGRKYYYRVCSYGKNISAIYTNKKSVRVLPGKATLTVKRKAGKKVKLSMKTSDNIKNFEVYSSKNGKKFKKVKTVKNKKTIIIKTKGKKYFKVRAYVTYKGKKYYGKFSKTKKIK